jgi:hypothetical protein
VQGVIEPTSTFTFTLNFENLAELELGALLWALELEEGMHHRLGYAKPLGFGSVRLKVKSLETMDWAQRWTALASDTGWRPAFDHKTRLVEEFKAKMREIYPADFERARAELANILGNPPGNLPVHYPRKERNPHPEGKNFEWFKDKSKTLSLALKDQGLER